MGGAMNDMLLDHTEDVPTPEGYQVVDSEIDFLRYAVSNKPLLVRGDSLCRWAEAFCNGRNLPYRRLLSPTQSLRELIPGLSETEAESIRAALPDRIATQLHHLTLTELLQALFPNVLWEERPSIEHAADWLLWLSEQAPDSVFEPLLAENGKLWQRDVDDATYTIYSAKSAKSAQKLLDDWLGLTEERTFLQLGEFPRPLPTRLQDHATNILRNQIISKQGELIDKLEQQPIQHDLRRLAAQETVHYLTHNPGKLTPQLRDQLTPYLTLDEQNHVLELMPPAMPELPPEQPEAILDWFRKQYLPARWWQVTHGSDVERDKIREAAENFARWYLREYPRALNGGLLQQYLSFSRTASAQKQQRYITLCLVLDGLHALDAKRLLDHVSHHNKRLVLQKNDFAFAPLPTITEVCKPALFSGVPPKFTQDVGAVGVIVPERESPADKLQSALPGDLYLWRIMEPDRTYHKQSGSETLAHDIDGRLASVARKISDIVNQLPTELPLCLIITTDHGRLLAKATRILDVPNDMKSQGRASLGKSGRHFDEHGFFIEENVAYLHAERFGLTEDAAIAFGEDIFRTNDGKTGSEWYPHGGLYPEEVIVPWIELVRDAKMPEVTASLSGSGQAGQSGQLTLKLLNPGDIPVTAVELSISIGGQISQLPINQVAKPYGEQTVTLSWSPWPGQTEVSQMAVTLNLQLPNGLTFAVVIANTGIESTEMYRRNNILGDLDL